jgi:exopolysaccharide biosynthesis protein
MNRTILAFLAACSLSALTFADISGHPYPAVTYTHESQTEPAPQQIHVATIDLTQPGVRVRVVPSGPDPDGDGPWQTVLGQPTKVADREHLDVVVNGDFFSHLSGKDAEGEAAIKEFKGSTPAKVIGVAVTDGKRWATTQKALPTLVIDEKEHAAIVDGAVPADAVQAIGGHDLLVRGGKNVAAVSDKPGFVKGPHPRTAVGVKDGGRTLLLVVVDGRDKELAKGMSLQELADVFVKLGATDAINLDGGGSSVLAIRDPRTHVMTIVNSPSDKDAEKHSHERAVANVLGVQLPARKGGPSTRPAR